MHKFQVGDIVVPITFLETDLSYEVIVVVEGEDEFEGFGEYGTERRKVYNSYIVKTTKSKSSSFPSGQLETIPFSYESYFDRIFQGKVKTILAPCNCPRCGGETISKSSQDPFTGQMFNVNKCNNCGWC